MASEIARKTKLLVSSIAPPNRLSHRELAWHRPAPEPIPGSESNGLGSCEAHHVAICTSKDCSGTAGAMGEGEGGEEEGGVAVVSPFSNSRCSLLPTVSVKDDCEPSMHVGL
jgi:hypothetical protein